MNTTAIPTNIKPGASSKSATFKNLGRQAEKGEANNQNRSFDFFENVQALIGKGLVFFDLFQQSQ